VIFFSFNAEFFSASINSESEILTAFLVLSVVVDSVLFAVVVLGVDGGISFEFNSMN
jgi:hypothetical protein